MKKKFWNMILAIATVLTIFVIYHKAVVEPMVQEVVEVNGLLLEQVEEQGRIMDIMISHIGDNREKIDDITDIVDASKQPHENVVVKAEKGWWDNIVHKVKN